MPIQAFLCDDGTAVAALDAVGSPNDAYIPNRPFTTGPLLNAPNVGKSIWKGLVDASVVLSPPTGCEVKTDAECRAILENEPFPVSDKLDQADFV